MQKLIEDLSLILGDQNPSGMAIVGKENIKKYLTVVSGGRFLSVEAMNEALRGLNGVRVEIPNDEIARLDGLFPSRLYLETLAKMEKVKDQTEGESGSLFMQLPAKVRVDGKKRPFTIAVMQEIMRKAFDVDKNLWTSEYVPEDIKNKVWDSSLSVWTSAFLKGSRTMNYQEQLKHQTEIFGAGYGVEADMILAMNLRYISQKEELMRQGFMRLNVQSTEAEPLGVFLNNECFFLASVSVGAVSDGGMGCSFRISPYGI